MSSQLVRLLQQADKHLRTGNILAAQTACDQALRKAPRHPDVLMLAGVVQLALGRPDQAVPMLDRALMADPRHGAALEHLGLAHLMLGRFADAEQVLARAARLTGAPASVHMRLGIAMLEQGRAAEALPHLERAAATAPDDPDVLVNLGRAHGMLGNANAARASFESALRSAPHRPEAAYNLGVMALSAQDLTQAERRFEQALSIAPDYGEARLSLGIVNQRRGQYERALDLMHQALERDPGNPEIRLEIARTHGMLGDHLAAREHYLRTLALAPAFVAAYEGLASASLSLGRPQEAIEHLRHALEREPANVAAWAALGNALFQTGRLEECRQAAEQCLALDADNIAAIGTLANVLVAREDLAQAIETLDAGYHRTQSSVLLGMLVYLLRQGCDWKRWATAWQRMERLLAGSEAALGSPFWLMCEPVSGDTLRDYTARWADARFGTIAERPASAPPAGEARRLRIGYLSSDLHEHATAYLIADVMERHDRSRFEVFAYSHGPDDGSPMRQRMRSAFEHFVDIAHMADDAAAERIRADSLDLLVDLKGYTLGDRLTIMARRPCARQATWLGYPGTTAAAFMDYIIADPVVIPTGHERHFSEEVVRMPMSYQPNDRARVVAAPLSREAYGLPDEGFVFCCFNQTYKITPDVFGVWMRLLARVTGSVLWLLESNPVAAKNLAREAEESGIDPRRIVFAPRRPNAEHLARYRVADLALDTFPYTSHTTMSDALWCGCVAVGLCGETFASRVSSSLLCAAGLEELVTQDLDQYEALGVRIASHADYFDQLRVRVAASRDTAPLFDPARFVRDLEALFEGLIAAR